MSRIVQPLEPENVKDVNVVDVPPIFEYQKILGETIVAKDEAKVSEINANTYATQAKTIANNLPTLVNDYVAEHKEELKGGDGKDGKDGKDGINGVDGKSVTVIKNDNGADVIDGYGNVVTITNGADGKNGVNGQNGADGKSVSVIKIDNGARVTDGNGNAVDVLNGKDGEIPADKLAQIDQNTQAITDELLQIERLEEKQEAMWKLMNNINYEWKEIDNNAYSVSVPLGAKECILQDIESKTVNVNQMFTRVDDGTFWDRNSAGSWRRYDVVDDKAVFTVSSSTTNTSKYHQICSNSIFNIKANHSYLLTFRLNANGVNVNRAEVFSVFGGGSIANIGGNQYMVIKSVTADKNKVSVGFTFYVSEIIEGATVEWWDFQCVDLTEYCGEGNEYDLETCKRVFADYIPYTPAPIPTTIECDKLVVKGKNLVNVSDITTTGYKLINLGTTLKPNVGYVFSCAFSGGDGTNNPIIYPQLNGTSAGNTVSLSKIENGRRYAYFKPTQSDFNQLYIYPSAEFTASQGVTATFANIQIEQGTTNSVPTDFSPYSITEIPLADKTIPFSFEVEGNGTIDFHNSVETKDNIQSNTKYFIALNEVK